MHIIMYVESPAFGRFAEGSEISISVGHPASSAVYNE